MARKKNLDACTSHPLSRNEKLYSGRGARYTTPPGMLGSTETERHESMYHQGAIKGSGICFQTEGKRANERRGQADFTPPGD
jgi:hypothetical protein